MTPALTSTMPAASAAPRPRAGSWLDRFFAWRDRTLASPMFQRWAAGTPFTHSIAQRRAGELFDLCAGFVYSQVLAACVELRVFDLLRNGPLTADELAARVSMPAPAIGRLLEAAVTLRLVNQRSGDTFGLGELGAALLANPGVLAMIRHHQLLYSDLADPVALLRGAETEPRLRQYWHYSDADDDATLGAGRQLAYTELMSASQQLIADDVVAAYPIAWHRSLLDVGGGDGTFLAAVAANAPRLRLRLFDLPAVAQRARQRQLQGDLTSRIDVYAGNFLADPLPGNADLVTLIRVLHDHDDEDALRILRAVREQLPRDGVLLIAEPLADTPGAERVGSVYFNFYLLAMGRGRARSARELKELAREAGFGRVEFPSMRRPLQTRLAIAHPGRAH